MTTIDGAAPRHRNRNYENTHRFLIERAAELIAKSGADGVSLCALARVTGINRSTVYYHFETREALMTEAQQWSSKQTAASDNAEVSRWQSIDEVAKLFQSDPEVISSWIDNYMVGGAIRQRYPQWDRLVAQIGAAFAELDSHEPCDPEVYSMLFLAGSNVARRHSPVRRLRLEGLDRIPEPLPNRAATQSVA